MIKTYDLDDQDWELISEIFVMLGTFENQHNWDLSDGERGLLARAIFDCVKLGLQQQVIPGYDGVFEHAFVMCWGPDHECGPRTGKEKAIMGNFLAFACRRRK